MNKTLLTLLKTKTLGRWCKVGAWCVLGFGTLQAVLIIIDSWNIYQMTRNESDVIGNFSYLQWLPPLISLCSGAVLTIVGFVILYVAGTIFTTLATALAPTRDETEDIVYESLNESTTTRK